MNGNQFRPNLVRLSYATKSNKYPTKYHIIKLTLIHFMHVTLHPLSRIKLLSILRLMAVMIRHMSHDRNNVGVHGDKAL